MAKNSVLEATRLLLQSSAKVYYRGLSETAKAAVRTSFFAADKRGEGRISLRDFLSSGSTAHDSVLVGLFRFLDADGTGFLELDEFITLHYLNESGTFFCSSCGIPILIGGYSCTDCPPPGRDSFDICLSCYASPTPPFKHHHPRTSFVNLVANYQQSSSKHTPFNSTMPSNNMTREAAHIDESGLFKCDCCGMNIITDRYTCKECVSSFDLCLSCYVSRPPYFRHHHPYSSFVRKVQSQANAAATAAAAEVAAATAVMNANMAMHAEMAAAAAMNAHMATMSAAAMNANMAAMGHLNHNLYPNYAPPVQGNSTINAGIGLIGKLVGLSLQTGLLN